MKKNRCAWTNNNEWNIAYHDAEWGVPVHDDRKWFEFMVLDAFQAGLSWLTILKKREHFRRAFDNFEPSIVANYSDQKINELINDEGIIRNRQKIAATVNNARQFLLVQKEFGSFDAYIWQFTGKKTIVNAWTAKSEVPARTAESDAMSRDLTKRGFKFAGSTICYAFMQAAGMVNDHTTDCFRYHEVQNANH